MDQWSGHHRTAYGAAKERAKELRRKMNTTVSDRILIYHFKENKVPGIRWQFRRPVDAFIPNFVCKRYRAAIYIYGPKNAHTVLRSASALEVLGWKVLTIHHDWIRNNDRSGLTDKPTFAMVCSYIDQMSRDLMTDREKIVKMSEYRRRHLKAV